MPGLLSLVLASSACAAQYVLRPSAESDGGYTVTVDHAPTSPLARSVAVPVGSIVTVTAANHKPFSVTLIGPSGIMDTVQERTWSGRLSQGGGYRLQFGPANAILPPLSVLDLVAVDDLSQVPSAGDEQAQALYPRP